MSSQIDDLTAKLDALALEDPPESRIDLARACHDGIRSRRRRRSLGVLAGAAGVGTAAALTAALLPGLSHPAALTDPAAGSAGANPAASAAAGAPATFRSTVPAAFGWLPANAKQVNAGYDGSGANYAASTKSDGGASIYLTFYDVTAPPQAGKAVNPTSGPSSDRSKASAAAGGAGTPTLYEVTAPDVNGHRAYWLTATKGDPTNGGDATLVWQDAGGKWLSVEGSGLGGDPVQATLEHIAGTVRVGTTDLALPVRIKGMPNGTVVQQAALGTSAHGAGALVNLTVDLSVGTQGSINVFVAPQGTALGPWSWGSSACKTANDLRVCVVTTGPIGSLTAQSVLDDTTSLGTNPSGWSPDLLAG
ncbi:hypothetical protein ABUW04_04395 [Streptacidiphilus sp. N1-10]|uniref:Uncharacterized protein n=1 Tax=Streptacidiphilus jeojiensis TaxID=3229225 RepID=A0ABV6XHD6_9ACTN